MLSDRENLYLSEHVLSGEHYLLQRKINRYLKAGIGNLSHEQMEALMALLRQAKQQLQSEQYEAEFQKMELIEQEEAKKSAEAIQTLDRILDEILAENAYPRKPFEEFPERAVEFTFKPELLLENMHDGEIEACCDSLFGEAFTHMEVIGEGRNKVRILHFKNEDNTPAPSIYMMGNRIAVPVHEKVDAPTLSRLNSLIHEFGSNRQVNIIYPDALVDDIHHFRNQLAASLNLTLQTLSTAQCATPWLNQVMQQAQRDIKQAIHAVIMP